jgi:2-amino-4-hydroxy-6-hydroxymethyldihydropteridine diphosphokinase
MARALIGLGANLGDRPRTLHEAVEQLAALPTTRLLSRSAWQTTAPVGGPAGQDAFLNGAVLLETALAPAALHGGLHAIEAALGRRRSQRWEARVLDLDLLLYDDLVMRSADLDVPHPGLAYRRFVLEPAAEIAADLRHPTIGLSIGQLLAHLNAAPNYLALHGPRSGDRARFATQLAKATGARLLTLGMVSPNAAGPGMNSHESTPPESTPPELDPPIQSLKQGIEFLAAMQRSLAAVKNAGVQAFVSDFCWSAFSSQLGMLAPDEQEQLIAAWQADTRHVPITKLLVVLGGLPFVPGASNTHRGPYLQVDLADAGHDALAEVVAAIEAMR